MKNISTAIEYILINFIEVFGMTSEDLVHGIEKIYRANGIIMKMSQMGKWARLGHVYLFLMIGCEKMAVHNIVFVCQFVANGFEFCSIIASGSIHTVIKL